MIDCRFHAGVLLNSKFRTRCILGLAAAVKRDGAYGGPTDVGRYEFGKVGGTRPLGAAHLFPL